MKYAIAILVSLFASQTFAQEARTFDCEFPIIAIANISPEGGIQVEVERNQEFRIVYNAIDGQSVGTMLAPNTASTGVAGGTEVQVFWMPHKVTFLEVTGDGTFQVTTVYGNETGKLMAVHSRATGRKGMEMPSQNYGSCVIK